jgi:NDP-mannose synthase
MTPSAADSNGTLRNAIEEMKAAPPRRTRAVILAGGRGTRLAPFTSVLPKPLMPIGERTILELVVEQLERFGFVDITLCMGYLSHLIHAVLESRDNGRVRIRYVLEQYPLGTAGPLRLVEGLDDTFIVMNGDVLTDLDYNDLIEHHRRHRNIVTIATHVRSIKIDYGVLRFDGEAGETQRITGFVEKPEYVSPVSMGIYVFEPTACDYISPDRPSDFPELVQALLRAGQPVGAYTHDGIWFDIGRHDDYAQAADAWTGASGLLGAAPGVLTEP